MVALVGVLVSVPNLAPVWAAPPRCCVAAGWHASPDSAPTLVTGVVRDAQTDAPVRDVRVRSSDATESARTTADGTYTLELPPGTHTLQFTHPGYRSFAMVVLVASGQPSVVDVGLDPLPAPLPAVRVRSDRIVTADRVHADAALVPRHTADGGIQWSHQAMQLAPQFEQSDVLRLAGTAATAATQSEVPTGLHLAGGLADQNLVLLDGIPIENAIHPGALASAVNPDAVETMTLYADRMPARFGGRLGGVVELETLAPSVADDGSRRTPGAQSPVDPFRFEGRAGYGGLALLAAAERAGRAFGFASVRHSPRQLGKFWVPQLNVGSPGWADELARGGVRIGRGELTALAFRNQNVVQSSADPNADGQFTWQSNAYGVSWRGPLGATGRTALVVRGWSSTSGAFGISIPGPWSAIIQNRFTHSGASADVRSERGSVVTHAGGSVERLWSSYAINAPLRHVVLPLTGAVNRTTGYVDGEWSLGHRWTVLPGLRTTYDRAAGGQDAVLRLEPRMGVDVALAPHARATFFYTGTTQPLQSLANEESPVTAVAAINLLNVQSDRVPAATSRMVSAAVTVTPSRGLTTVLSVFGRRSSHVLLVPWSTVTPFALAIDSLRVGDERSAGWYTTATYTNERLVVDATYRVTSTRLRSAASDSTYQPGFAATRAASAAFRYRPMPRTDLRASLLATGGRRTAVTYGAWGWDWHDALSGGRQVTGGTQATSPGGAALPPYLGMSVGASYEITRPPSNTRCRAPQGMGLDGSAEARARKLAPAPSCGTPAALLFVAVDNVLGHANAGAALRQTTTGDAAPDSAGTATAYVPLRPRTLVFGVHWWW